MAPRSWATWSDGSGADEALRLRGVWLVLGWLLVLLVIWLSLTPKPPRIPGDFDSADKIEHVLAYFALAAWFVQVYRGWSQRLLHGLLFVALGIALEFAQEFGGVRQFHVADMVAGGVGVILGLLLGATPAGATLRYLEWLLMPAAAQARAMRGTDSE